VLQDKQDNYGIDLFDPFWETFDEISGIKYTGAYPASKCRGPSR